MENICEVEAHIEPGVRRVVTRWGHDPAGLVQILREVHEEFGCLPGSALTLIARLLRIPYSRAKGVASFYSFLNDEPLGTYRILFSDNITDRMAGSERLMEAMCHRLWVEPGKVSEDGLVSIARTSCTGLCDQGPALLVNGRPVPVAGEFAAGQQLNGRLTATAGGFSIIAADNSAGVSAEKLLQNPGLHENGPQLAAAMKRRMPSIANSRSSARANGPRLIIVPSIRRLRRERHDSHAASRGGCKSPPQGRREAGRRRQSVHGRAGHGGRTAGDRLRSRRARRSR